MVHLTNVLNNNKRISHYRFALVWLFLLAWHVCTAQTFKIGTIEVYGNRSTAASSVLNRLNFKEGDSINAAGFDKEKIASSIQQTGGINAVTINPVCCNANNDLMIYIGIEEPGAEVLHYRAAPAKDIKLPDEMLASYRREDSLSQIAVEAGQTAEDDSLGYALMNYPPARKEQLAFVEYAAKQFALVADVLKNSGDATQRAAASVIIAYGTNKTEVINNLMLAVTDADETVRNNAVRALGILAAYARLNPKLQLRISAEPFIKMLNSVVWTDRNKGSAILMQLTTSRNQQLLSAIKKKALLSVIEMAEWKDRNHAIFAFFILGRMAGVSETELAETIGSKDYISKAGVIAKSLE